MNYEDILKLICKHTGKRINLHPEDINEMVGLVEAALKLSECQEKERLNWFFLNAFENHPFVHVFMEGVNNDWTPDQWRTAIDKARGV